MEILVVFADLDVVKSLTKCFRGTLVNYEAAVHDGLPENYSYISQDHGGVIWTVQQHNDMKKWVYLL